MSGLEDPAPAMHFQALFGVPTRMLLLMYELIQVNPRPLVEGPIDLTNEKPRNWY